LTVSTKLSINSQSKLLHDRRIQRTAYYRWCIQSPWKHLLTYDGVVNRYASTHSRTERRPQLFNLIDNPAETTNLAAENPKLVKELGSVLNNGTA